MRSDNPASEVETRLWDAVNAFDDAESFSEIEDAQERILRVFRTAQREAAAEALEEQARQAANAMECAREEGQSAYSKLWGYVAKKLSRRARQYREEAGREG